MKNRQQKRQSYSGKGYSSRGNSNRGRSSKNQRYDGYYDQGYNQGYYGQGYYDQRGQMHRGQRHYRDDYDDFADSKTGKLVSKMTKEKEVKKQKVVKCNNIKYDTCCKEGRYRNLRTGEVVQC